MRNCEVNENDFSVANIPSPLAKGEGIGKGKYRSPLK